MAKFQVENDKLPVKDGKPVFAVGDIIEAVNLKELEEKHPSLKGKVKRVLEVATPEKKRGRTAKAE